LTQLEEIGHQATTPNIHKTVAVTLAITRCALFKQHPSLKVRAAIQQSLSQLVAVEDDQLFILQITQARVLVTLDRPNEAMPLLERLTSETETKEQKGFWLPAAVLLSRAYQEMDEKEQALTWLDRAVRTAAEPGYIRLFVDEGKHLQQLLEELTQQKSTHPYTATLLTHFPAEIPSRESDPLSPREREVLKLIANGLTNQEIAANLVIAPSTAKRHTVNIYNKLGVNNRAQATTRAHELGILNLE
jgi:LuxR family maltose regulon positive regulatory protein